MIEYLNSMTKVLSQYVEFLFSLEIAPYVSIGSVFLVATLLWVITTNFWVR